MQSFDHSTINMLYKVGISDAEIARKDKYTLNMIFLFIIILFILFFYIKINITIDSKNWDIMKCNPKYIFFSGYLHNDTHLSNHDATIVNFASCTNQIKKGSDGYMIGRMIGNTADYLQNSITGVNENGNKYETKLQKKINKQEKKIKRKMDKRDKILSQYDSLEGEVDFNLDISGAYSYNLLKNVGIYMDQLNTLMDYISSYVKQFLTYRMMEHANNCIKQGDECTESSESYKKAVQIKNILNSY